MFARVAACAVCAGILAALVLTGMQAWWVTPLILEAEVYEEQQAQAEPASVGAAASEGNAHHEEAAAWQPQNGWQRTLATAVSNGVLGVGYAFLLAGLFVLWRPSGVIQGLAWGAAGYLAFFEAPALGLPPELPGAAAAELAVRQGWWLGTALFTAAGLGLLCLKSLGRWRWLGLVLLAVPHGVGAPQAPLSLELTPATLVAEFRWASSMSNAAFWLTLGVLCAYLFRRWCPAATSDT